MFFFSIVLFKLVLRLSKLTTIQKKFIENRYVSLASRHTFTHLVSKFSVHNGIARSNFVQIYFFNNVSFWLKLSKFKLYLKIHSNFSDEKGFPYHLAILVHIINLFVVLKKNRDNIWWASSRCTMELQDPFLSKTI